MKWSSLSNSLLSVFFVRDDTCRAACDRALRLFLDPDVREDCGDALLPGVAFLRSLWLYVPLSFTYQGMKESSSCSLCVGHYSDASPERRMELLNMGMAQALLEEVSATNR